MILDGKKIATDIQVRLKEAVKASGKKLRLAIIITTDDPATHAFVKKKVEFGEGISVDVRIYDEYERASSATMLRERISEIVKISENNGVIIQLPLRENIKNTEKILNAVPPRKDVDMLSARSVGNFAVGICKTMPPVAAAVREILSSTNSSINFAGLKVVVVGAGRVAGRPVSHWLIREGAAVTVVNKDTPLSDITHFTKVADIIVGCAGSPGLITGDMVREGVIAIDVGTTKVEGKFKGDFDLDSVSPKAKIITPPIGGIGPIVVAKVFENLLQLNGVEV